jgi:hypothetical protein
VAELRRREGERARRGKGEVGKFQNADGGEREIRCFFHFGIFFFLKKKMNLTKDRESIYIYFLEKLAMRSVCKMWVLQHPIKQGHLI